MHTSPVVAYFVNGVDGEPCPHGTPPFSKRLFSGTSRSQIVFEVKPWEAGADLKGLFDKIRQTEIDGLVWGEAHKLVPVAFGVKKLVLSCVVVDSKARNNEGIHFFPGG